MTGMWNEEEINGVVVARYANPPMNYGTDAAVNELDELIKSWQDKGVRAVILTSAIPNCFITHFSPEQILAGIQDRDKVAEKGGVRNRAVNRMLQGLTELQAPVIAALNGDAMGFGFELALACDFRIAQAGDCRYGLPEVRMGILPGAGGTQRLARLVGVGAALDIVLRARVFTPVEAMARGLVHEVATDAQQRAMVLATELAALPPQAVSAAKRALYQGVDAPLASALAIETDASVRTKLGPRAGEALSEYVDLPLSKRRAWLIDGSTSDD